MRVWPAVLGWMLCGTAAYAQTAAPVVSKGYVEAVAQVAFGNVTSQSYGGEIGITVVPRLQIFLDAGHTRDTSPSTLGVSAQSIAGFLSQTQPNVTFHAKQPATFGLAGVRYGFPLSTAKVEPYLVGGGGVARLTRDVSFTIAGNDVTNTIPQYGVALGSDLSGSETKGMVTVGGGVMWPVWQALVVDFQYRYGRIFATEGVNVNRAGVGLGFRF